MPQHKPIPELDDTDLCVLCGMCLPHCPTYAVYQNEAESPRGRISLIQAYARGTLSIHSQAFTHLDHCLGCMACEAMCPSQVPYGRLLQQAKSMLQRKPPAFVLRRILKTNTRADGVHRLEFITRLFNAAGLTALGSRLATGGLRTASQIASGLQAVRLNTRYAAASASGDVLLFTGCMSKSYDGTALESSIRLLNHYGFTVHIPGNQYCCGAMHAHNGQMGQARELERKNSELFEQTATDHIIYTSNGCGAHLQAYAYASAARMSDIGRFLLKHTTIQASDFRPLDADVMVHESCSSHHKLKISGTSSKLLSLIPDIRLSTFDRPSQCCGAGGGHLLSYPELAQDLLADKLSQLRSANVKYLVSDNLGCSLHFRAGLADLGLAIEVIHPISLLALQLRDKGR